MAKSLKCRPSEVYRMRDEFVAYAFDSAVTHWGTAFDAAAESAVAGAKDRQAAERAQDKVIRRWIPETRKYADPTRR